MPLEELSNGDHPVDAVPAYGLNQFDGVTCRVFEFVKDKTRYATRLGEEHLLPT